MEAFIATITLFGGNYAPRGWMFCQGQTLSIAQNTALFSLMGTTFGGNGQTTFNLPDLRGRVPVGTGQGPGLGSYVQGQMGGTENTTLTLGNLPAHNHTVQITGAPVLNVSSSNADLASAADGSVLASPGTGDSRSFNAVNGYTNATPNIKLGGTGVGTLAATTGVAGSSLPVSIVQPYLAMNYIICLQGIFPSRN